MVKHGVHWIPIENLHTQEKKISCHAEETRMSIQKKPIDGPLKCICIYNIVTLNSLGNTLHLVRTHFPRVELLPKDISLDSLLLAYYDLQDSSE